MADEFPAHDSVEDAIDAAAEGLVKKSSDELKSVEYYSIDELVKAANYKSGRTAKGKSHFGLRMTRLVPPGTG